VCAEGVPPALLQQGQLKPRNSNPVLPDPHLSYRKASYKVAIAQLVTTGAQNKSFSLSYRSVQHLRREGAKDKASTGAFHGYSCSTTSVAASQWL
jgi:hypothetical protein